ncbi:MAG: urease accessory protein [Acidobacteriota bacterium]|nr:urease accessory protein [Acidobacteriota bacterium]MDH3528966.1 urease accessory protein [Acidobacteriota bacterium]
MDLEITQELSFVTILVFGFVLGLKHAVEADHLAAVSTIVAQRKSVVGSALIGGFWGLGHTMSLLIVGALVVFLKLKISGATEAWLEAVVGMMLIVLGVNALRKLWKKETIHIHTHEHGQREHIHIHTHEKNANPENHHIARLTPRSVAIGMVHGLAGSAALMLLIVPAINVPAIALLYIALFGAGSIVGMMLMSFLIGLPMYLTAGKFALLNKGILLSAGLFSCGLGIFIVYTKMA